MTNDQRQSVNRSVAKPWFKPLRYVSQRALAVLIIAFVLLLPIVAFPQSGTSPSTTHTKSERYAAAIAAQLGVQFQDWRDGIVAPPADPSLAALDAAATDLAIGTAATVLNVQLQPSPSKARQALPHNRDERIQQAIAIVKEWHGQVRTVLKNNPYVGGYYMIGESVGLLRSLVISSTVDVSQPIIDKLVPATTNVIGSSRLQVDEDIKEQWVDIAIDLMKTHRTVEQGRSLRARLDLWFEMLTTRQRRVKPK